MSTFPVPDLPAKIRAYDTLHQHTPPEGCKPTERGARGAERCPVCAKHDHADARPFGWTVIEVRGQKPDKATGEHHVRKFRWAVPAYLFTCLACRGKLTDLEGIADACNTWTPEGARWRREHPELFPGQQVLIMDGDLDETGHF